MGHNARVNDILLGLLAIIVGALFCMRGYATMRVVIPIWGAFVGFMLGAGAVSGASGDSLLSSVLGWLVGLAVAMLFGALAYLYYEISVVLAMGGIGFMLGSSVVIALGIDWTWVIVLAGIAVGVVLALVAIVGSLPMILLTLLTASAGASAMVGGLMLIFGSLDTTDLDRATVVDRIHDHPAWWILYAVLVVAGIISQLKFTGSVANSLREQWVADGGNEFRSS